MPYQLPEKAIEAGLEVLALTDHDTTAGVAVAAEAAGKVGLELVAGVEISADPGPAGGTLHLLGHFIQPGSGALERLIDRVQQARRQRNPRIIERLQELGVSIDGQEVAESSGEGVVGRPHVAAVLVRKGYAKTIQDAFVRYLGEQGAAYVPKERPEPEAAIAAIHAAGGLATLAHPVQLRQPDEALHRLMLRLCEVGLDGLEVHHPDHEPRERERFDRMARRFGLWRTGGSDYHGEDRGRPLGCCRTDASVLEAMREAAAVRQVTG